MFGHGEPDSILHHYTYQKLGPCARYLIEGIPNKDGSSREYSYELTLEKVDLTIYTSPKVGILAFHVTNYKDEDLKDMIRISARGRRIYPPFLDCYKEPLGQVKEGLIADCITILTEEGELARENYEVYGRLKEMPKKLPLPKHIECFTKDLFTEINPIIDDRMFVVAWYSSNVASRVFSSKGLFSKEYNYLTNPGWHEAVFIDDNGCTTQSTTMLRALLTRHTYDRWVNYGTLFGLTRYSFVMLTNNDNFNREKLLPDLQNLYLPMVRLCLAQRASVLYFSDCISNRLNINKAKDFTQQKAEEIAELFLEYIKFVKRIYFREISAQEQGIDLYDKLQEVMRLRKEVEDLEREMNELNQFADMTQQKDLTQIANQYLPVALIAAFMAFIYDKAYFQFDTICFTPDCILQAAKYWVPIFGILLFFFREKIRKILN